MRRVQDGGGVLPQRASCLPHAWQRNLPGMQEAPYVGAEETGSVLPPRPPPTQRTERPGNPRTQQKEEETPLTHPGGRTTRNTGGKARGAGTARRGEAEDGDDRTGGQEAATNARDRRTTSVEEEGARHPEGEPDRRPQAEEGEGDHTRVRGATKKEEGP
ncbi:hypothetical protein DIPPA_08578 [Diplonema papillatum]|nr:hypothetical protein DIPPA_08578 [Diplonema papillatum]